MGDNSVTMTTGLHAAILALQSDLPRVEKSQEANAGKYSYKYADLAEVSDAIFDKLGPLGLTWVTKPTVNEYGFVLHYALMHSSGEGLDGFYPLPDKGSPQDIGGAITYARRYALCAVTGLAPSGDDNDAKQSSKTKEETPEATLNEWLELIRFASTVAELQGVWNQIGHAGLGTERRLMKATNERKRELGG